MILKDFPGWSFFSVRGPNASEVSDFMHRITSANFKKVSVGGFTAACQLDPKGKLLVFFKAFLVEPGHYLCATPQSEEEACTSLELLHFRENLKILPTDEKWRYFRTVGGKPNAESSGAAFFAESQLSGDDFGIFCPASSTDTLLASLQKQGFQKNDAAYEKLRIEKGLAEWDAEIQKGMLPLEANLDWAIHENKGCYPGQEVIERIRAIGDTPRWLVRLSGANPAPGKGSALKAAGTDVGIVTSTLEGGDHWQGLGLLRRTSFVADGEYQAQGHPVRLERA